MVIIVDHLQVASFHTGTDKNPHALYNGDKGGAYTYCQSDIEGVMKYYALVSTPGIDSGSYGSTYKLYSSTDGSTWTLIHTSSGTRTGRTDPSPPNEDFHLGPGIIQEIEYNSTRYLICNYCEHIVGTLNWDITSRVYTSGSGWSTIYNVTNRDYPVRPLDLVKAGSYIPRIFCWNSALTGGEVNYRAAAYDPLGTAISIYTIYGAEYGRKLMAGFVGGDYYYYVGYYSSSVIRFFEWNGDPFTQATIIADWDFSKEGTITFGDVSSNLFYANSVNSNWYIFTPYEVWILENVNQWNWRKYTLTGSPDEISYIWQRISNDVSLSGNQTLEYFVAQNDSAKEYTVYKVGNTLYKFQTIDYTGSHDLTLSSCDSRIGTDDGLTNGLVYELEIIPYEAIGCVIETGYGEPPVGLLNTKIEITEDEYNYFYDRNDILVMEGFLKNVETFGRSFGSDIISPLEWDFEQLVTLSYSSQKTSDILKDVIDRYCSNIWYDSNSIVTTSVNRSPNFRNKRFDGVLDWAEKAEHFVFYITPDFKAHFNDGTRKSGTINYGSQTGNFTVGIIVEGTSSGATGVVVKDVDNGTTGTLTLTSVAGDFDNSETISDSWGGSATTSSTLNQNSIVLGSDTIVQPKKKVKRLSPSYVYAMGGFVGGVRVIGVAQEDEVTGGSSLYFSYPSITDPTDLDNLAESRLEASKSGVTRMNFSQRKYGLMQYGQSMNFGFDNPPFNISEGSFFIMGYVYDLWSLGELIIYDALDYPTGKTLDNKDDKGINPIINNSLISQNAQDINDIEAGGVTFGSPTGNIDIGDSAVEGSSGSATRTDHQHQFSAPSSSYPVQIDIGDSRIDGSGTAPARSDHGHAFPAPGAGYPVNVAATEADGSATTPARSDHKHAHGTGYSSNAHHTESHALNSHSSYALSGLSDVDSDLSTVIKSLEVVGTTPDGAYPGSPKEGQIHWDADECMLLRWNVVAQAWIDIGGGAGLVGGDSSFLLKAGGTATNLTVSSGFQETGKFVSPIMLEGYAGYTKGFVDGNYGRGPMWQVSVTDTNAYIVATFMVHEGGSFKVKFVHSYSNNLAQIWDSSLYISSTKANDTENQSYNLANGVAFDFATGLDLELHGEETGAYTIGNDEFVVVKIVKDDDMGSARNVYVFAILLVRQ